MLKADKKTGKTKLQDQFKVGNSIKCIQCMFYLLDHVIFIMIAISDKQHSAWVEQNIDLFY
jgi:hypothetical protein